MSLQWFGWLWVRKSRRSTVELLGIGNVMFNNSITLSKRITIYLDKLTLAPKQACSIISLKSIIKKQKNYLHDTQTHLACIMGHFIQGHCRVYVCRQLDKTFSWIRRANYCLLVGKYIILYDQSYLKTPKYSMQLQNQI